MLLEIAIAAQADGWAAAPVLASEGAPSAAVARVVLATGRDLSELRPAEAAALFARETAALLGPGELTGCGDEAPAPGALAEALAAAEQGVSYSDPTAVGAAVARGEQALLCGEGAPDTEMAARLYFLAGVQATAGADQPAAFIAFRRAHLLRPGLVWDTDFAPDGKSVFELAAADARTAGSVPFRVAPPPEHLLVDGRESGEAGGESMLVPGTHLVTAGRTWRVDLLAEGSATLLLPRPIPTDAAGWVEDPARRGALEALLEGALGAEGEAWVVTPARIVRRDMKSRSWEVVQGEALPEPAPVVAEVLPPAPRRGGRTGRWLAWGGGGVAVGGLAFAVASKLTGDAAVAEAGVALSQTDRDAYEDAVARRDEAAARAGLGYTAAGIGAAAAGAGLLLYGSW